MFDDKPGFTTRAPERCNKESWSNVNCSVNNSSLVKDDCLHKKCRCDISDDALTKF